MRKIAISVLIVTLLFAPMVMTVYANKKGVGDLDAWYYSVPGVLADDYFYTYPWARRSLTIGFSRFGEKIKAQPAPTVGLQYWKPVTADPATSGADPFANPGVSMFEWVEGWWLALTYQHRTLGWRTVWAWAMFSDFSDWGSPADTAAGTYPRVQGGWIRYRSDTSPEAAAALEPHGGRKTNALVVTEDPVVLYNGPRKYIALLTHTLKDQSVSGSAPYGETGPKVDVVKFTILIEFNKDKKEVIQKKDVKLLLDDKTMITNKAYLELRNSGQWDLGTSAHYRSYAHFYTNGGTVHWGGTNDDAPTTEYGVEYHKPSKDDHVSPCTGYGMQWPDTSEKWGYYAKAQIISSVTKFVGWAAFWPHPSYWSVDGFSAPFTKWGYDISGHYPWTCKAWRTDDISNTAGTAANEPEIPFVGGEWDFVFNLDPALNIKEFRGITTYGVTDLNDGKDWQKDGSNKIDSEVKFQNDEIFNPYDLNEAVHKEAARFVEYKEYTTGEFTTKAANIPVLLPATWGEYCSFSEKVLLVEDWGVGVSPPRLLKRGTDYSVHLEANGRAHFESVSYYFSYYTRVKILYSVYGMYETTDDNSYQTVASPTVNTLTTDQAALALPYGELWKPGVEPGYPGYLNPPYTFSSSAWNPIDFIIYMPQFYGQVAQSGYKCTLKIRAWDVDITQRDLLYINGHFVGALTGIPSGWSVSAFNIPVSNLDVKGVNVIQIFPDCTTIPASITVNDPATWPTQGTSWAVTVDWGRLEFTPQYEWITVGTISAPIDSAGAAMVSEAFDSLKQTHVAKGGLDIPDTVNDPTGKVPWLFRKFGSTGTRSDYRDYLGRTTLLNDFCESNAIKTSNMIHVGGPVVNFGTEFMNDFVPVFYGLSDSTHATDTSWRGKIIASECWFRHTYSGAGYAVIAVYKDIDGSVHLGVWGMTGVDTYYACMWLWDNMEFWIDTYYGPLGETFGTYTAGKDATFTGPGIVYLQQENPGVVAIILKFDYSKKYNVFGFAAVLERIGTISQKYPHQDP